MLINHKYKSKNFRSRNKEKIQFLVLHYTAVPLGSTLGIFCNDSNLALPDSEYYRGTETNPVAMCNRQVSSHYVNSEDGEIYQLVDEEHAAFHAGDSFWYGHKNINNQSIGIEQVNIGYNWLNIFPHERGVKVEGSKETWCKYNDVQITATIELCKKIIKRHDIKPYNIVGHSDIACNRKSDPGPLFPWKKLAEAGVGIWYDISESSFTTNMPQDPILWMQRSLAEFGYDCDQTGLIDPKSIAGIESVSNAFSTR